MDKEIIKKYKKQNGNKYVKNNDLLWYIVARLDDVERELSGVQKENTSIKTQQKVFWILLPIAVSLCVYFSSVM